MVLFFDSGIGGLAYLQEFLRRRSVPVVYLGDTAFFPYGDRSPEEVRDRVVRLVSQMADLYPLDAAVIACNTASVVALDAVRRDVDIPVIGVVPAVKPAAGITRTGHIAVLSTNRTAGDPYTEDLVRRFARYSRVTLLGLPRLVQAAEENICGAAVPSVTKIIEEDVKNVLEADVDTVVLACTHFIGIRDIIARVLGPGRTVVDSLDGVVRRLIWTLDEQQISVRGPVGRGHFVTTGPLNRDISCLLMEHRLLAQLEPESV